MPQTGNVALDRRDRERSYRYVNRLTDYQLLFGGFILICQRGTHSSR